MTLPNLPSLAGGVVPGQGPGEAIGQLLLQLAQIRTQQQNARTGAKNQQALEKYYQDQAMIQQQEQQRALLKMLVERAQSESVGQGLTQLQRGTEAIQGGMPEGAPLPLVGGPASGKVLAPSIAEIAQGLPAESRAKFFEQAGNYGMLTTRGKATEEARAQVERQRLVTELATGQGPSIQTILSKGFAQLPAAAQTRLVDLFLPKGETRGEQVSALNGMFSAWKAGAGKLTLGEVARAYGLTIPEGMDPNAVAPRESSGIADQRAFTRSMQLYNQFQEDTRDHRTMAQMYGKVLASYQKPANESDASAAADLSLIFGYMKLLDPGSVVREGEQATAANARGVSETVRSAYNRVLSGAKMSQAQRDDFLRQTKRLGATARQSLKPILQRYRAQAQRQGVNPDDVAYDWYEVYDQAAPEGLDAFMRKGP